MASRLFAAVARRGRSCGALLSQQQQPARLVQERAMVLGADHTSKWMQRVEQPSPMELVNAVPPILVHLRVVVCRGGPNPALGHPVEYINVDAPQPAVCKYCGLRFLQEHHH
ncbi:unnamed protein product [Closterium sp. Yama58-4]|nr:unnamed protein product [Closterium sp. Yama58-4]